MPDDGFQLRPKNVAQCAVSHCRCVFMTECLAVCRKMSRGRFILKFRIKNDTVILKSKRMVRFK